MCEAKMDPDSPESEGNVEHGNSQKSPPSKFQHRLSSPPSQEEEDVTSDDLISVGGSPNPSISSSRNPMEDSEDEYFRPLKKLRMLKQVESGGSQTPVGVKSFSICDILSHKPNSKSSSNSNNSGSTTHTHHSGSRSLELSNHGGGGAGAQRIVRPWDPQSKSNGRRNSSDSSPLDALFQMTSKTFEGLNGHHESSELRGDGNAHQLFNSRQPPKKKRKSRTAFTNHQIFELEKRFLYQKYLSPADRDDIANQLGLTNAQVITWFQNRRAKLKRDMEELKKDMESAKILSAHKSFLESAHDLGLLKKRAQSQMDMSSAAAAASFHLSSPASSSQSSHSPINLTSESPPSIH